MNGEEDLNYLNTLEPYNKDSKNFRVNSRWKQKTDFIGLNYYRRLHVPPKSNGKNVKCKIHWWCAFKRLESSNNFVGRLNDLGWEIYSQGLYEIIRSLTKWNTPILHHREWCSRQI